MILNQFNLFGADSLRIMLSYETSFLIFTAVYHRTTDKYGQKGLPFPFIEAGHIGQNVYLLAQSLGIGCCAIGQFKEKQLCKLLDINPFEEYPIYYIALGN